MRRTLGCLRKLVMLVVFLVLAGAAYVYRDRLAPYWALARARFAEAVPAARAERATPELAEQADEKLGSLEAGGGRASFSGIELQSLLEYRYRQLLPGFVDSPRVEIEDGRARLRLRVPVDRIPRSPSFEEIAALLPDTTDLSVHGQLIPTDDGGVAFAVDELSAHRIPLPGRLVPGALEMLGRRPAAGLPEDAIAIPLPRGARAAYLRGDSLVLLSNAAQPRN